MVKIGKISFLERRGCHGHNLIVGDILHLLVGTIKASLDLVSHTLDNCRWSRFSSYLLRDLVYIKLMASTCFEFSCPAGRWIHTGALMKVFDSLLPTICCDG